MATATTRNTFEEYVHKLASADPATALSIALAENERQQAIASQKHEEYRTLSEVKFDTQGRIVEATMGGLWRLAQMYAGSMMVPEHYRGKPHDCFIACQMAMRLKVDPFAYMQSSYVVHGRPGLEGKFAIAMLNMSGKIKGRVRYKFEGEGQTRKCTALATDAETGEEVSAVVDWAMVKAEKWDTKAGSKWLTIPTQMFHYRSATFLIRAYFPEVLMGINMVDELEDMGAPSRPNVQSPTSLNELADRLMSPLNGNDKEPDDVEEPSKTDENGLKEGETLTAGGEIIEHAEDASQIEPDFMAVVSDLKKELTEAKDLAAVQRIEDFYLPKVPADKSVEVHGPCDEKRETIRASRGSKSNQKNLAGAT